MSVISGHAPGPTSLAFSLDGRQIYTGGSDALARIWKASGQHSEPDAALEAVEALTALAAFHNGWLTASKDSEVRRYAAGSKDLQGLVVGFGGLPIWCLAVDPDGNRVAVGSDETSIKVVDLEDTTRIVVLKGGHVKPVRKLCWHPSGSVLASAGADGRIVFWNVDQQSQSAVLDAVIPKVTDPDLPEWPHDTLPVFHPSGNYFWITTKAHQIVKYSYPDLQNSLTLPDDDQVLTGGPTTLSLSPNGLYLAAASRTGLAIWDTNGKGHVIAKFQNPILSPPLSLAWSPTQNLLAWTDHQGSLIRWSSPVPSNLTMPYTKPKETISLFDKDPVDDETAADVDAAMDDDWILDDTGLLGDDKSEEKPEEEKEYEYQGGVREMVSVTKAQRPFQPGSTPLQAGKRYLAYTPLGTITSTTPAQSDHSVVTIEFFDRSARRGWTFQDRFNYELASLGERAAVFACPPSPPDYPAHVLYHPYTITLNNDRSLVPFPGIMGKEWRYELSGPSKDVRVVCVALVGPAKGREVLEGTTVAVATSLGELVFLSGDSGIEERVLSVPGEVVCLVGGKGWLMVVAREGGVSLDGAQNLISRIIHLPTYTTIHHDALPIPRGEMLRWVGVSEEGMPLIYTGPSPGILSLLPLPLFTAKTRHGYAAPQANWIRILDTRTLERQKDKERKEGYWPVGAALRSEAGEAVGGMGEGVFMCLVLRGNQEHPGFPRPILQEVPLKMPFRGAVEDEVLARTKLYHSLTPATAAIALTHDKTIMLLIQGALKTNDPLRALDLARRVINPQTVEMSKKVGTFYGMQGVVNGLGRIGEEMGEEREEDEEVAEAEREEREERRGWGKGSDEKGKRKAFQDLGPPPAVHRPGLVRATPSAAGPSRTRVDNGIARARFEELEFNSLTAGEEQDEGRSGSGYIGEGKRKREREGEEVVGEKRRAVDVGQTRTNPFARKAESTLDRDRNPFARKPQLPSSSSLATTGDASVGKGKGLAKSKSLHKSESFFDKVESAEAKRGSAKQTTLFGFSKEKDKGKKVAGSPVPGEVETQDTEVVETQDTEMVETQESEGGREAGGVEDGDEEPIEWPPSPPAGGAGADEEVEQE